MNRSSYVALGWRIAPFTAGLTFIACWIYSFVTYGFLLGVGLGWFPSLLVALVAGALTIYLWGFAALAAVALTVGWFANSRPAEIEEPVTAADYDFIVEDTAKAPSAYQLEQERLRRQFNLPPIDAPTVAVIPSAPQPAVEPTQPRVSPPHTIYAPDTGPDIATDRDTLTVPLEPGQ